MKSKITNQDLNFKHQILELIEAKEYYCFNQFIVSKMRAEECVGVPNKEKCIEAYHIFYKKVKDNIPASVPTMKKWFGVLEYEKPKREHILKIGFSLQLSVVEVNEYLTVGNLESELQVNDFREWIYMYGYENGKNFETCNKMIQAFSRQLDLKHEIQQTSHTNNLKRDFEKIKHVDETKFLSWMIEHATLFKGYSATVLHYFEKYKHQVFLCVKEDAKNQLNQLLTQTDYNTWNKTQILSTKSDHEKIIQYVKQARRRKSRKFPDEVLDGMIELSRVAYLEKESDRFLLSAVYAPEVNASRLYSYRKQPIYNMTVKHLSDLLNIARHKSEELQLNIIQDVLEDCLEEEFCPNEVVVFGEEQLEQNWKNKTVKEVYSWIKNQQKERKRRQILVRREDLLPLVLYVSQHKYVADYEKKCKEYNQNEAQSYFVDAANAVLNACCMAPVNKKYLLDKSMMLCFQKNEMYSYSDLLECIYR